MILYTPLPLEDVFEGIDGMTDNIQEIALNGVTLQVQITGINEAQIVRLISPNPQDFMNPAYAPGNYIQFTARI